GPVSVPLNGRLAMRASFLASFVFVSIGASAATAFAADEPPFAAEHPGAVALSQEEGKWIYRKFPTSVRLYVSEEDEPGKSNCNRQCAFAWPPLLVERENAQAMGQWTIIIREDGRQQWAYKDQPVYMRFHDSPAEPSGTQHEGWSFLEP
ncbi:MAG: hypothetical protein RLN70_08610, partial [Rhodospirillaceae bacterium]